MIAFRIHCDFLLCIYFSHANKISIFFFFDELEHNIRQITHVRLSVCRLPAGIYIVLCVAVQRSNLFIGLFILTSFIFYVSNPNFPSFTKINEKNKRSKCGNVTYRYWNESDVRCVSSELFILFVWSVCTISFSYFILVWISCNLSLCVEMIMRWSESERKSYHNIGIEYRILCVALLFVTSKLSHFNILRISDAFIASLNRIEAI